MLVALGKMRWIAALLVVSVVFTLCGCHSADVAWIAMSIMGAWSALTGIPLETLEGTRVEMLALALAFFIYTSLSDADAAVAGNICDLTAMLDNDGDGIGDTPLELHGPWVQDGNHVTATLTPTGVASAQVVGGPQVNLDLQLTDNNTMAGTITYTIGSAQYSGPVTVYRN
ncbi:MAG TPA: hypothetical protein DGT21_05665 [Armatimonadetes bacterium]|nr:hypothetical protein [Armatimonadota bacterium]